SGDSNTYKALRAPPGRPLTFVLGEQGIITADPEEVDKLARKAWIKVYDGVGVDEIELVARFISIYKLTVMTIAIIK
ncbi:MAG: hypothetical protein ACKO8E_02680, partial [Candidatus Fonsibacter sp.]